MKIQYCSDLHIDYNGIKGKNLFRKFVSTRPQADILILAGDIAEAINEELYSSFINYCCKNFKHVILVSGNHEYYNSSILDVDKFLKSLELSFSNFSYLFSVNIKYWQVKMNRSSFIFLTNIHDLI